MDVAKLVFDFDATSATAAERQVDSLEKTTGRLEQTAGRLKGAYGGGAFEQARSSAGAYQQSLNSLIGVYGQARDALGRFAQEDGKYRMSQDATAKMLIQNARTVEAFTRQQEQAAKAAAKAAADAERERRAEMDATAAMLIRNAKLQDDLARQQEQAAATTANYASKVASLRATLDPFAAVQLKLAQNTKLLDDALAHGAITGKQYEDMLSRVTRSALSDVQALDRLQKAHGAAGDAAKLQSYQLLNLGRQGADVFVSLASGQALWMVAVQQGAQIGEIFAEARTQGVSLKSALSDLAGGAARALFSPGGLIAAGVLAVGGLAVAFAKGSKEAAEFKNQLTITGNAAGLTAGQFEDMARRISDANDTSFADTKRLVAQAAASGKLSGDTLALAVENAQNFSKYTGESASKYLAEYEKMRGGVAKFAAEHALVYHDLTLQQIKQIEALEKANKAREAEQRLMENIAATMQQRAEPAYGWLEKATISVTKRAKDMWDAILGVGREKTVDQKLADAQERLAKIQDPGSTQNSAMKRRSDGQYTYGAAAAASAQQDILRARMDVSFFQMLKTNAEKNASKASKDAQGESDRIQGWLDSRNKSTPRDMTDERTAELDRALATAKAAELQAQLDITKDIETRAKLEKEIAQAEWKAREAQIAKTLAGIEDDKGLSAAKKNELTKGWEAVRAAEQHVVDLKVQGIDQQAFNEQIARRRAVEDTIAGFTDRQARSQVELAKTLEEAQAVENNAIADRQAREASRRDFDLFMDWADGKKTEAEVQQIQAAAAGADAADREVKARNDRLAIFQRDLQLAQQGYRNELELLGSRKNLAQSSYEAAQFDRQIAGVRYNAERDELERTLANKDASEKDLAYARARLPVIAEIYRNELRQLELSDNAVTAYADLVGALSNAARAVIDGDIGGSISAAGGVLRQLSGLAGSGTTLGSSLATAASYAGPIGAAVSAVTGVLGAIGDRSAAKAQAKIERLTKAVEDLRSDNKTSSGSIAAALAEANANWNSDLEYSSAILTALRSIDAKTGAVAALVARQISAGSLLSTNSLGLGSSTSQGGLGGALSGGLVGGIAGAGIGAAATAATGFLMSGFAGAATALAGPFGLALGAAGALAKALTKTKTTTELLDQGLQFTAVTFDQIAAGGVTGSTYADLLTTTKKSLLGVGLSTKVKTSTINGSINSDLLSQISGVVQALGDGVLSAASVFGVEAAKAAESALGSAVVDLGKLSLKDLKPDEIADVLNATFDKVGDQLAAAGVPGLDALGQVGEGAFETLTRVAREYQVVDVALQSIGKTFGQVGLESIAARDELVKLFGGADAFTSSTSFFGQNFLTDAERLAPIIGAVNDNLKAFGLSAESSRDAFKNLVLAQDLTTEAGRNTYAALLNIAPAFDKVASAAEDAAATVIAKAKERADYEAGIQAKIDDLALTEAQKRERDLAAALAVSEKAGELTKQLWALEDAAAATAKATEDAAKAAELAANRQSALADLYDAQGRTAEATALRRAQALAAITDPLQRAYQEMTYAATDAAQKVTDARSVLTDAYNAEKSAIEATRSKFADLAKTLRDFSGSLSSQALDALDPIARRNATLSAFQDAASRARLGDSDAAALIPKLGEEFRSASEAAASSQIDYLRDLSYIRRATDDAADTAERQVSAADRQLEALNASVAGLIQVNQSVISVQEAIANLTAATMAAKSAGVVSVGGQPIGSTGLSTNPASPAGANAQMAWILTHGMAGSAGAGLDGVDPAYVALGNAYKPSFSDVAGVYGVAEAVRQQQAGLLKFATGGSFMIGGNPGVDQNLMSINGQPAAMVGQGEIVTITPPGRQAGGNDNSAVIARLEARLASMEAALVSIATSNNSMDRRGKRQEVDGIYVRGEAPGEPIQTEAA